MHYLLQMYYYLTHSEIVELNFNKLNSCDKQYVNTQSKDILIFASLDTYLNSLTPVINNLELNNNIAVILPKISKNWNNYKKILDKDKIIFIMVIMFSKKTASRWILYHSYKITKKIFF